LTGQSNDSEGNIMDEGALPAQVRPHPHALNSFTIARTAERFAYSGAQTMLIYYLIDTYGATDVNQGYAVFSWLVLGFAAIQVLGGLLTDLLVDARKAVVWGGLALAVGYFILGFGTTITDVLGAIFILGGSGFYTPASITSLGLYYRGREPYLLAGMHTYQAGIFISLFISSLFFGFAMQFIDWRQGLMLCGIVMILGHIYLLAICKAFAEPYLTAKTADKSVDTYGKILPVVVILTGAMFYLLYTLSLESGSYKMLLDGTGLMGFRRWLQYLNYLTAIVLLLAGSWSLTRKPGSASLRFGTGAILGVSVLLAGLGLHLFTSGSIGNLTMITAAIFINVLIGLVEVYFVPALFALIIQNGRRATNTWIGLLALFSALPFFVITNTGDLSAVQGILTVGATIVLTTSGLWFIKNRKMVDQSGEHSELSDELKMD
jgi:MFS family permease